MAELNKLFNRSFVSLTSAAKTKYLTSTLSRSALPKRLSCLPAISPLQLTNSHQRRTVKMAAQPPKSHFHKALESNSQWAALKQSDSPEYFEKFTKGQSPGILWLGCSDSRVPETTLLDLQPGEVFVHRNIANIVTTSDLNVLAVIEYAVVHLKVSHIVLCGHTSCGGAAAALTDSPVGGVLDAWLVPLRAVRRENQAELEAIEDGGARAIRLAELNVKQGVKNLMANHVVQEAIRGRGLKVHGTLYDIGSGLMRELGVGTDESVEN